MRIPFVAGNWKMNTTVDEALKLVRDVISGISSVKGVQAAVCPPFTALLPVSHVIPGSSLELGAQNMYAEEKGAFTGEISPVMINKICKYVILGHSERRHYFGESNELINKKVVAAFKYNLIPILCVGERLQENEAGKTNEVLDGQLRYGLAGVSPSATQIVAYEPVWAIGTGKAATATQANTTIRFIRDTISDIWGQGIADQVRIIYGGSVTGTNMAEFMSESDIDGALVGGASLKAAEFVSIVQQAVRTERKN